VYIGLFWVHIGLHIGLSPQHTHSRTSRARLEIYKRALYPHKRALYTHNTCGTNGTHSRTSRASIERSIRDFRMDTGILCIYRALFSTYRALLCI